MPDPQNTDGGVLVQVEAVDLNFADILQCQGTYQVPREPPFIPGLSAVGIVLAADDSARTRGIGVGDRVIGMTSGNDGGYAEQAVIKSSEAVRLEADVDPVQAAAAHVTYFFRAMICMLSQLLLSSMVLEQSWGEQTRRVMPMDLGCNCAEMRT